MGFLAPVAVPMLVGAGVGAIADKNNPLRGAMLGAVGGSVMGPAMSGLTSAGAAATEAAMGAGMGEAAGTAAAQTAAAQGMAGVAAESPLYNAMIGDQLVGTGTYGMQHYLGSAGATPMNAKLASLATMGPQGMIENLGVTGGKGMLGLSPDKALRMGSQMIMGQQQQPMPPPPAGGGGGGPRMAPPVQPVSRFVTGMPQQRKDPRTAMWGY